MAAFRLPPGLTVHCLSGDRKALFTRHAQAAHEMRQMTAREEFAVDRRTIGLIGLLALASCGGGGAGVSGTVGAACIESDRNAATPQLCSCIQSVADATLSNSDQRRVATFFADPELAQEIRASDTSAADAFWDRYLVFIDAAQATCG